MQAEYQSSSEPKAITSPARGLKETQHLIAIRIVGTALLNYQVHKTSDSRIRLESLTTMARLLGDLSATEVPVVDHLLDKPIQLGTSL